MLSSTVNKRTKSEVVSVCAVREKLKLKPAVPATFLSPILFETPLASIVCNKVLEV